VRPGPAPRSERLLSFLCAETREVETETIEIRDGKPVLVRKKQTVEER